MEIAWFVCLTPAGRRSRSSEDKPLDYYHHVEEFDESTIVMTVDDPDDCGGSVDFLQDLGLNEDDVRFIHPVGISTDDMKINICLRDLAELSVYPILLADDEKHVYVIPAVCDGKLVEFQVSDGLDGRRTHSLDVYTYSEASDLFDKIVEEGWTQ